MKKCRRGNGIRFTASLRIRVELAREAQAAGGAGHHRGDQVVQVTEGGGELQGAEADVVQGLVVEHHALVGVLDELVDRQRRCKAHHGVGHLGRGHDGEGEHCGRGTPRGSWR